MWTNPILFVIQVTSSNILFGYSKLEFSLFLMETCWNIREVEYYTCRFIKETSDKIVIVSVY